MSFIEAAIIGTREVLLPVTFSILTNIVAFLPLCFVPGMMGKIWRVIPFVVITVFAISWVEALLILPCHLAHTDDKPASRITARLHAGQQTFARLLQHFIRRVYAPFIDIALRWRFLTVAAFAVLLMLVIAYVASGASAAS
jgi:multidrug efflux pump subunit AcrB